MTTVYRSVRTSILVICFLSVARVHWIIADDGYHSDDGHHSDSHSDDSESSSSSSHDHDDGYSFDDSHGDYHHGFGSHGLGGLLGTSLLLNGLSSFSSITTTETCTAAAGICLFSLVCSSPNPHDHGYDSDSSHSHGHLGSILNGRIIGTCNNSLICCGLFNAVSYHKVHRSRRKRRSRRRRRRRKHVGY